MRPLPSVRHYSQSLSQITNLREGRVILVSERWATLLRELRRYQSAMVRMGQEIQKPKAVRLRGVPASQIYQTPETQEPDCYCYGSKIEGYVIGTPGRVLYLSPREANRAAWTGGELYHEEYKIVFPPPQKLRPVDWKQYYQFLETLKPVVDV